LKNVIIFEKKHGKKGGADAFENDPLFRIFGSVSSLRETGMIMGMIDMQHDMLCTCMMAHACVDNMQVHGHARYI
jgi:hypothetical protein